MNVYADNIEALRRSGIQSACGFIYPKASRSSSVLSSYWRGQGVGRSCAETRGRPYISWERERLPDLPTGRAGPGDLFGRDIEAPEVLGFGAIQSNEPKRILGLLPWQALLVVAGAWVLWPEKQ